MGILKGETVFLYEKKQTGIDGFNAPIYEQKTVAVDNVLICQPSAEAVINDVELYGKHIEFMLCIPKGDTHDWTDAVVEFHGQKFHTFGFPAEYMEHLVPLDWNKQIKVERYG